MRITFGKLKIKNFLSFDDEEFDFSAPRKMALICGKNLDIPGSKNGVGKSAMFSALLYVLYGQLQNKVKNENLRNRYVKSKDMALRLDFKVDNLSYTIIRGLKGNSSFLRLFKNDPSPEEITKSSIAETDEYISNEVLHCDISIFSRIVYLTSEQTYNFFKLKQQQKKDFIEKLFDISIFGDMYALIHKDVLKFEKERTGIQSRLLTLSNTESEYEDAIKEFETRRQQTVDGLKTDLETTSKMLEELEKSTPEIVDVTESQSTLNDLTERQMKAAKTIGKVMNIISEKKAEKSSLVVRKKSSQKMLDTHSKFIDGLCEDCRPKAEKYFDTSKYESDIATISEELETLDADIVRMETKLGSANEKMQDLKKTITDLANSISARTEKATEHERKISSARTKLKLLEEKLNYETNSTNPYLGLMASVKEKIDTETSNFKDIEGKLSYLSLAENIVSQDTIKKFIVKDLVSLLNVNIKGYLKKMGANFTCVFDENMDYEFRTDGGTCEYDNFSSGEKMRLLIASSFAFKDFMMTRTNIQSNILVLDEFIDSNLDTKAINSILKILKEISYLYGQSVYVISHRHEIDNSIFDNIIQIVKELNISRITYLDHHP